MGQDPGEDRLGDREWALMSDSVYANFFPI